MRKFASNGCFVKIPLKDRFWEKVNKNGPMHPTDKSLGRCWMWIGARITDTKKKHFYGLIWTSEHNRRLHAHRVAWELMNGPIPKGKQILHSCDNPPCVNPSHTRPGTDADNHRDMVIRGRALNGEKNPAAILTRKQALDIRKRYPIRNKTGPRSAKDKRNILALCKKHHISWQWAWRIAAGARWKHLA